MYLDWWKNSDPYYVIDIEADSLTPSVIHVMAWEDVKTGEKGFLTDYEAIRKFLLRPGYFIGHNILKFDAPVLNRIVGSVLRVGKLIDTLILSTLYHPSIPDGHSLGAWGSRLGLAKIDFNDFSKLTPEMVEYCQRDVSVNVLLFKRLTKVMSRIGFSEKSCYIQHYITSILERQRKNGFYFDGPRAIAFYQELRGIEENLTDQIRSVFPPEKNLVRNGRTRTKSGGLRSIYSRDCDRFEIELSEDGETYSAYEQLHFNIGSPIQRVEKLVGLGWRNLPDEVTKTGNPKPFDKGELAPSLEEFLQKHDVPEVRLIAEWMTVNGRANMVNTWLENWNEEDSCIHGKLFSADTLRFRHQAPNTANIPAVRTKEEKHPDGTKTVTILMGSAGRWTYEARDLWTARPGRVLVGTDAAGLELRMLAHYLNRPAFTDQVVKGDPHQYNADLAGVSRPRAKTLLLIASRSKTM